MGYVWLALFLGWCSVSGDALARVRTRGQTGSAITRSIIDSTRILCTFASVELHLDGIMELYCGFDGEDKRSLVVHPDCQAQRRKFREDIKKKRIFVAVDTAEACKVIAFLKLFIIPPGELAGILHDELRVTPASLEDPPYRPNSAKNVVLPFTYRALQSEPYNLQQEEIIFRREDALPFRHSPENIYIYCGSLYTAHNYRGCGAIMKTEEWALSYLIPQIQKLLRERNSFPSIFYTYGMVARKRMHMTGRLRAFAAFTQRLRDDEELPRDKNGIPLRLYRFLTTKPNLCHTKAPDPGFGFLLEHDLSKHSISPGNTPRLRPAPAPDPEEDAELDGFQV